MSAIFRCVSFDPDDNMTTRFGLRLAGCMYDEELAGPDGMHFHVWVPRGTTLDELRRIRSAIRNQNDLVSMSFDYLESPSA